MLFPEYTHEQKRFFIKSIVSQVLHCIMLGQSALVGWLYLDTMHI